MENMRRFQQQKDTEHSYLLLNAFYSACLLRQARGLEVEEDSVIQEVFEMQRKILDSL